ncbi:poly(A) polymerase [filamentous cyanobacterium CCP2]|nr:poly(A) polymerase [filamentous cyanobacterium CCP2]
MERESGEWGIEKGIEGREDREEEPGDRHAEQQMSIHSDAQAQNPAPNPVSPNALPSHSRTDAKLRVSPSTSHSPLPISYSLTSAEATVMALGIHVDTGSLTYDHATVRDAAALTWLMAQGASLQAIAEYVEPGLSPTMQDLLTVALDELQTETVHGYQVSWVLLSVEEYIPGLSNLASRLLSLTEADVLLLAARYAVGGGEERLTVIGRSHSRGEWRFDQSHEGIDLGELFEPFGGGGHPRAAALTTRGVDPEQTLAELLDQLRSQIPHPPVARELMSSPVRTIRPDTTIQEAQRILLRYGHSGLSVVDEEGGLVGIISRRDLDIALHHGFSHARVKGYMTTNLKTIAPETPLTEIESLMMTYDIGRLPVLDQGELVGIVTRTDVLRQLHREKAIGEQGAGKGKEERGGRREERGERSKHWRDYCVLPGVVRQVLRDRLAPTLWDVLMAAAKQAEERGWQLYLVGGAVRDLFLSNLSAFESGSDESSALFIPDIDLVVDGFHRAADQAAGVELARALQQQYPSVRLQVHGRFQTAALTWHNDPNLNSLWIDIATARTEFYPYPAANPEVEASSIRQDLYRRDFTINAMAIRLTAPRTGEVLDFFGGLLDLQEGYVRVLHANSFIEDPTRIYRAVRFAVRLGFQIDPQTEGYIRHAIASGVYHRIQSEMEKFPALQTRLKQELRYILEAPYWFQAIRLLDNLGAICCIHSDLQLTDRLWWQLRLVDRWLKQFDTTHQVEHWLTLLEVLLTNLTVGDRVKVAENLQLPSDSIQRLQNLDAIHQHLTAHLPECDRPSQIYQLLNSYDLPTLTLLAVIVPRPIRRQIWQYLTRLAFVKPPLNGNDLKALGYQPGRQFKPMLEALLAATLDGKVHDRSEAEKFLGDRFPLQS